MATKVYLIPEIGFVQVPDSGTREYLIPEGGFFSEGAGSASVEVSATCDSLTLTENSATVTVKIDVAVSATCDELALTEYAATVNAAISITTGTDALALTTYDATIAFGFEVDCATDALTITTYEAGIESDRNIAAGICNLTLSTHKASVGASTTIAANCDVLTLTENAATISIDINIATTPDELTITGLSATIHENVVVSATCDALSVTTKYAVVAWDSKAVIETGWAKDRNLGPWTFNKPPKKYGYQNNPRWVAKDRATTFHKPCGYWPLVYSEIGWYQQVVAIDKGRKIVGASMISQDNAQYKLLYLNYETDSIIKQVDFSTSERAVHTYYGATMMFDNADGVPRILYLNYEDALLRSYAYDYTGRMVDVTIATDMSTDFRTQGAYLGSGVVVAVNSDATNTYCYKSTDYGNSWSAGVTIVDTLPVILAYDGVSRLYAAYTVFDDTQPFQMKYSTNGTTWIAMSGLPDAPAAQASTLLMTASGNNLMAIYGVEDTEYLVISANQGASWSASAFPAIAGDSAIHCDSIYLNGSIAFASAFGLDTGTHYILRSTDAGANWSVLPHPSYITTYNVGMLEKNAPIVWNHDDDAMVATFCGYAIYPGDLAFQISFDDGESWMQRSLHIGADNVDYGPNPVWTMPT